MVDRFSLSFNGLLASLCYLLQWLVCLSGSWLTDALRFSSDDDDDDDDDLRSRQVLSTLTIRKINTVLGLWVTAICSVLAVYSGCQAGKYFAKNGSVCRLIDLVVTLCTCSGWLSVYCVCMSHLVTDDI